MKSNNKKMRKTLTDIRSAGQRMEKKIELTARLGAVQVATGEFNLDKFLKLREFERMFDHGWRSNRYSRPYGRFCQFSNGRTKIDVVYEPNQSWMPSQCVTISPVDNAALRRLELEEILSILPDRRLLKVAFDYAFRGGSGVNEQFALAHLLVGRSKVIREPHEPNVLSFGSRKSAFYAKCHSDESNNSYSISIAVRRELLQENGIATPQDFHRLPELIFPHHFAFYTICQAKLSAAIVGPKRRLHSILRQVVARENDLQGVLQHLRKVGLKNPSRFLTPLTINQDVEGEMQSWARDWAQQNDDSSKVDGGGESIPATITTGKD